MADEVLNKPTNSEMKSLSQQVVVYNVKIPKNPLKKRKYMHKAHQSIVRKDNNLKSKMKFPSKAPVDEQKLENYSRGEGLRSRGIMHPIHKTKLKKKEKKIEFAMEQAARAEILLTEEPGYLEVDVGFRTSYVSQKEISDNVDIAAATKHFELKLEEFGPYRAKYTKNGRHLLLGGKKGHIASFDWVTKKLHCELNVMESVFDISWLHLETMFAVAQKDWVYIYDNQGIELHCIKQMNRVIKMEFLPYHFLLASVNDFGFLSWLDISIGQLVNQFGTRGGRILTMKQNPYNATLCTGNTKGVVSLWSPNSKDPLAKILCHKSPVNALTIDKSGMYMASSGSDRKMKIWDIRNLDGPLQVYGLRSSPVDLDFSQKNVLALGLGNVVEVYKECCSEQANTPYMRHRMVGNVDNLMFCPYEDVLGVATDRGFVSLIIPGSGEANYDALESNPFQTKKQRREAEVKALLEKIQPELITLDPFEVTQIDVQTLQERMEARSKIMHLKPKTIDYTPRKKKKGGSVQIAKTKKVLKQAAKREFVQKLQESDDWFKTKQEEDTPRKSLGVLDRFVSNKKGKKIVKTVAK